MNKFEHQSLKVKVVLPEPFTHLHWLKWNKVADDNSSVNKTTVNYLQTLAIMESGEVEVGGKTYDLASLKDEKLALSVEAWVGLTGLKYVLSQFEIAKNSSTPPSEPPTVATETTS